MNKNQKIILAIFMPVIIFLVTLTIAYYLGVERGLDWEITHNPFDWGKNLVSVALFFNRHYPF